MVKETVFRNGNYIVVITKRRTKQTLQVTQQIENINRTPGEIVCHLYQLPNGKQDTITGMAEESKAGVPRRHMPVVQRRGHHVPGLQAEPREQGRHKLDNQ